MRLNVNPNRMELSKLKGRLSTATRGHKLLKDKQDELMRRFIDLVKQNNKMRIDLEKKLTDSFKDFLMASALMSPEFLESALSFPKEKISVDVDNKNIMSVNVPVFKYKRETESKSNMLPYGYAQTSGELDLSIEKLSEILSELLSLAEIEKTCELMASEIEKTRRRVNALEYRTIPDLEETIKFIKIKLDENERSNITRLMKVKEIIKEK